uniref:Receptor ligand binding region domain-containing protein n=1 Tax=Romanomermis culicivorax TaxID=13658 RepID=A0A915HWR7_ROMCU
MKKRWVLALLCHFLITGGHLINHRCIDGSYGIRPWVEYEPGAQVSIAAIFPMREQQRSCGHVTALGVQLSQTAKLLVDIFNRESFIPGVKIATRNDVTGINIFDYCAQGYGIQEILSTENDFMNCSTRATLGITGPSSEESPVVELTSISLDHLSKNTPGISSTPRIEAIALAMINTVRHFQWSHSTMLYENSSFGLKAFEYFSNEVSSDVLCIGAFLIWSSDDAVRDKSLVQLQMSTEHKKVALLFLSGNNALEFFRWILADAFGQTNALWSMIELPQTKGMFVVSQTFPEDLTKLENYFSNLDVFDKETKKADPVLADFYQNSVKCKFENVEVPPDFENLPLCSGEKFALSDTKQDLYVSPVVLSLMDAVQAFGAAYKKIWKRLCSGKPGLCHQLKNVETKVIFDELVSNNFTYDFFVKNYLGINNRTVSLVDSSHNLAVYQLTTDESDNMAFIQCSEFCSCKNQKVGRNFLYEPGDYIILATFPIRHYGTGGRCGSIRLNNGFQMAAAFYYAIQQANKRDIKAKSLFNGKKIGYLIIDSCNSPSKISYLINGLMINNKIGEIDIDSTTVIGLIGDLNDNVSLEMASLAKNLHIPHISYGSKSKNVHSFKTTVSDESRLDLTIEFLKATKNDLVQTAYSSDFVDFGADLLDRIGKSGNICVAASTVIDFRSAENVTVSVKKILDLVSKNVTSLIIVADKSDYKLFLENSRSTIQEVKISRMTLLAPLNFGHDVDLAVEIGNLPIDVVTFAVKRQQNPALKSFISSISLDNGILDPWLGDYISSLDRCDLENSEFRIHKSMCKSQKTLAKMASFKLEQNLDQVVNGVRVLLVSLGQTLRKIGCFKDAEPCSLQEITTGNSSGRKLMIDSLRNVIFKDETGKEFSFTKNMDAGNDISILTLSDLKYEQIGYFRHATTLRLNNSSLISSQCSVPNLALCQNVCPNILYFTPQQNSNTSRMTRIYAYTNLKRDLTNNADSNENNKPAKHIIIGAVFRVTGGQDCSLVDETGILSAEAFLWTIDSLNRKKRAPKGWSLSGLVINSCGSYGADVLYDLEAILANGSSSRFQIDKIHSQNVWAFLTNPATSENYRNIDALLADQMISNIHLSYNNHELPYALSMQISDEQIDRSTLAILESLNWTKIAIAYSSKAHVTRFLRFKFQAQNRSLCPLLEYDFRVQRKSYSRKNDLSTFYEQILDAKIRILVILLDEEQSKEFLADLAVIIRRSNAKNPKTMSTLVVVAQNFEPSIQDGVLYVGALTFRQYIEDSLSDFYDHFLSFKMDDNDKNPWWPSFYQQKFKCRDAEECDRVAKLDKSTLLSVDTFQETLLTNIMNAVRLAAAGLENLSLEVCGGSEAQPPKLDAKNSPIACDRLFDEATKSREQFFYALKNSKLEFSTTTNEILKFDEAGQLDFPLKILNLISDQSAPDSLQFELIGKFQCDNLTLLRLPTIYRNFQIVETTAEEEFRCRRCKHCSNVQYANQIEEYTTSTTVTSTTATSPTFPTTTSTLAVTSASFSLEIVKSKDLDQKSFILIPSSDDLYLLILIPLHHQNGRICAEQYENMRSIIWVLDNFNARSKNLNIGALIFDTFSDPIRALIFLKDFRDGTVSISNNKELLKMKHLIGVINSPLTNEAILTSEYLNSLNLTNVSPGFSAISPKILREGSDDYSLRTSVSVSYQSKAVVQLLKKLHWNAMAVIYSSNSLWATWAKTALDAEAEIEKICVASSTSLDFSTNSAESCESKIDHNIRKLFEYRRNGLRAVVLLLEPDSLRCFMQSLKSAVSKGKVEPGDFTFVILADVADLDTTFAEYVSEIVGMIVLRYETADPIRSFQKYMKELQILNKDYNDPWLDGYLKHIINCQYTFDSRQNLAPECREKLWNFYTKNFTSNSFLLNAMNAAGSLLQGFSNFLAVTCGSNDICPKFKLMLNRRMQETDDEQESTNFRKQYFEYVRGVSFDDASGRKFEFSMTDVPFSRKTKIKGTTSCLYIVNLDRTVADTVLDFNKTLEKIFSHSVYTYLGKIGIFENFRLKLKLFAHGFKNGVEPFNLRDQPSTCLRFLQCPAKCLDIFLQNRMTSNVAHSPEYEESSENNTSTYSNASLLKFMTQTLPDIYYPNTIMQINFGSPRLLNNSLFVPSSKKMYVVGVLAMRDFDVENFVCGSRYKISSGFQALSALQYALNQINDDPYLLPETKLGLIVLDSCSSEEKTIADLFDYFNDDTLVPHVGANFDYKKLRRNSASNNGKNVSIIRSNLNIEDIIGVVGLGGKKPNHHLRRLLNNLQIPHISMNSVAHGPNDALLLSMLPSEATEASIFCEIATAMKWTYVAVVHDMDFASAAEAFTLQAEKRKICIGKTIVVKDRLDQQPHTDPLEYMQMLVRKLVVTAGARAVFTFLGDNNLFLLMKALVNEKIPVGRFVLVTKFDEDWSYDSIFLTQLLKFGHGFLFLEPARFNVTGFSEYFSKISLLNGATRTPRKFLEEFWQHHFRCVLSKNLPMAFHKRTNLCSGQEKIMIDDINISPAVPRVILAVHALSRSAQKYVGQTCPEKLSIVSNLKECAQTSSKSDSTNYRETQFQILKSLNFSYTYQPGSEPFWMNFNEDGSSNAPYAIRNLYRDQSGVYKAQEVGYWKAESGLVLDDQSVALFDTLGERRLVESKCPSPDLCSRCYEDGNTKFLARPEPPDTLANMSTVWGVLTAASACIGLLVTIVCIIYFLFTFPIMYSTTVLGYFSLTDQSVQNATKAWKICRSQSNFDQNVDLQLRQGGVLSLYALSFTFIMPPSSWTCPIRKYCFGLCWTLFIGPLLIKVAHNWRTNAAEDYESSSSGGVASPGTLFALALAVKGRGVVPAATTSNSKF